MRTSFESSASRNGSAGSNPLASGDIESSVSEHSFVLEDIVIDKGPLHTSTPTKSSPFQDAANRLAPFSMEQAKSNPTPHKLDCVPPGPRLHPDSFSLVTPNQQTAHADAVVTQGTGQMAPSLNTVPPRRLSLSTQALSSTPEAGLNLDLRPHVGRPENEPNRRRSLGLGRERSIPLKVSIDLPRDRPADALDMMMDGRVHGRLVRKRTRLPLQYIIFFGIVGCYAAIVTTMGMSLSAFNFSKIRVNRARDATDQLRSDLMPLLEAIQAELARLVNR